MSPEKRNNLNTIERESAEEAKEAVNPRITQEFVNFIKSKAESGEYRVNVKVGDRVVPIDVFPSVFPPKSDYSVSSRSVFEAFGDLSGKEVADIGCGSGIESIVAKLAGAVHVDASDVNYQAVECAKHNARINGLEDSINVFSSDLLQGFPQKKYDLIIANLPIVNFSAEKNDINNALYDEGYQLHKRLFEEAKDFLAEGGELTFTHANLQSAETMDADADFQEMEKMIGEYGYEVSEKISNESMGFKWVNYKIRLKK